MKGSRILQITGVLLAISAVITLVANIIAIISSGAAVGEQAGSTVTGIFVVLLMDAFPMLVNVLTLIAGIWGARNWKTPQKAGKCATIGFIILVLNIVTVVLGVMQAGFTGAVIASIAFLLLPILYVVGALQLKRQ